MNHSRNLGQFGRPLGEDFGLNLLVKSIGKRRFIELARHAAKIDPDVQRVIDEWDGLPPLLQRQVDLNYLCQMKAIDPRHLFSVVAEAEMEVCNSVSVIIAALSL